MRIGGWSQLNILQTTLSRRGDLMPMSPAHYRVRSISQAAEDLQMIQLRAELEFYKALSLEFGQQLEGVAECLAAGSAISIAIGHKPAVVAVRKRGKA